MNKSSLGLFPLFRHTLPNRTIDISVFETTVNSKSNGFNFRNIENKTRASHFVNTVVLRILFLFFIFFSAFKWPLEQTHTYLSNSHFFHD